MGQQLSIKIILPIVLLMIIPFSIKSVVSGMEKERTVQITAHRGASISYPENTMIAFKQAKKHDADWIELDVHECKDGNLIVMHDYNFLNATGVDKDVSDAKYKEIKKYNASYMYKDKYKNVKIPLLEDVIKFAKESNAKLNIELKSYDSYTIEQKVIDIIKKYNFEDECVVASQKYEQVEKVKLLDENISTLYVTWALENDPSFYAAADNFSIEYHTITQELINKIHSENKKISAWVVNDEQTAITMLNMGIDNIITDNIVLIKNIIEDYENELDKSVEYKDWRTNRTLRVKYKSSNFI